MKTNLMTAILIVAIGLNMSLAQTQKLNTKKPFKINVSQSQINQLNERIQNTRWVKNEVNTEWNPGISIELIKEVAQYWSDSFDWKAQESYLNSFHQFTAEVNDITIHFIYEKGSGDNRIPVLFLHGWPGDFTEFLQVTSKLKKSNPNIDIIVPSIPGFGFSDSPDSMSSGSVAEYIHQLMSVVLGYSSYYVHGGDYGAFIAEKLAFKYTESVRGLLLSDIPFYHLYAQNENLSEPENEFLQRINEWSMNDGAYAMIQGTKPKILSTGLNDSPMALAAWFIQLYNDFGDKEKDLFDRFSKTDLLTIISIYWFNEKIYSSMRIYSEDMSAYEETSTQKIAVPVGFGFYPHDISSVPPKEYADRYFENIIHWSEHTDGGHFAALSHPDELIKDLLEFIQKVEYR